MRSPLRINLSGCADCRNGFIIDVLEKRIHDVEEKTALEAAERIRLIKNRSDLDFQERSYDRRGFFKVAKNFAFLKTAGLFGDEDHGKERQAYSEKTMPLKRELLNKALERSPEETREALLKNYYYTVDAADTCNNCFACIGMCPTGALKIEGSRDDRELFFNTSLCNGCGLCEGFCMSGAVALKKGFSGDNPFEFIRTKKKL